ncbi:hypothetical protein Pan97_24690 [Bremerella volcania]|uniref:Uncharacterized protein n=1 Tax=Bremerella volcania TaxID=2527984 RepID=A0A518C879_9BACT|nr:hypothetical protein [Bremerella volcania]QDU75437.1 hypothetical protein Pan97_24690 [Bremerella volcania]
MTKSQQEVIADLLARRDAVLAQLAGLSSTSVGALPNTTGTGDHVDHTGLRQSLYRELAEIDQLLERIAGPHEAISRGRLT